MPHGLAFEHLSKYGNAEDAEEPSEISKDSNELEFVVGAILRRKFSAKDKNYFWLVEWEGYGEEHNSWEPESVFISQDRTVNDIWKVFEETHPRRKKDSNQPPPRTSPPQKRRKSK